MSNHNKEIINALVNEDIFTAKKLINQSLFERMNNALEEKLIDFAPTVFNEGKLSPKQEKIAKLAGDKGKIDAEDLKTLRNKKKGKIDEETAALFQEELASLVEDIETELGTELTEEEIIDIANDLLDVMNSDAVSDDEDDDSYESDFDEEDNQEEDDR
jgi:hypothetical protein